MSGGPSLKGELSDLGSGGARVILHSPLAEGQFVRLNFPGKADQPQSKSRMIIGCVVHSRRESERYVVGIAFGWDAAMKGGARPTPRLQAPTSRFLAFFRKGRPRRSVTDNRRNGV
jgi:PilZ domain